MRLLAIRTLALSAALLTGATAFGQTTYQWSATGSTPLWGSGTNWDLGAAPGSNSIATNSDTGNFASSGTATNIQFNFGTIGQPYYVGTIQLLSTNTLNRTFGSNASIAGTLVLNGTGANSVILSNLSSANMTVAPQAGGGSGPLTLRLGNSTLNTINLGAAGNITISAIITGTNTPLGITGTGSGRVDITNAANTFTGNIRITGGEARFSSNGSLGNATNSVMIDGGRFAFATGFSTLAAAHNLFVGDTAGTAISTTSGTVTYNGVIANVTGKTGSWVKQGIGTLALGGISTYTGSTTINEGILQLITGNNRLPTGTVVNLGQATTASVVTFDLNSRSQTIAGLNSIAGTNSNTNDQNIVTNTSNTPSTLTLGGSGTYNYSDGTAANSGVLTGSINVMKSGSGTQTFGGNNTYAGITSVNGGTLLVTNVSGSGTGTGEVIVNNMGTFGGNGTIYGNLIVNSGGTVRGDSGTGSSDLTLSNARLVGGSGTTGATLATQLAVNGSGAITDNSQIVVSTNTFNVDVTAGKFNIRLLNDLGLTQNASYTIALVTGAGGSGNFFRNGAVATGVNAFTAGDFNLISGSGAWTFSGVSLTVNGSNNLVLQFTPVPEPATVLAVGAVGLGVAGWVRRRRMAATVTA